jgi:hypothetical protein
MENKTMAGHMKKHSIGTFGTCTVCGAVYTARPEAPKWFIDMCKVQPWNDVAARFRLAFDDCDETMEYIKVIKATNSWLSQ